MSKLDIQALLDSGATPAQVAKELRAKGISRFLFNIDDVGQFDSHWSVYVHEDEKHLLEPSE
jgi:hypothetical protein